MLVVMIIFSVEKKRRVSFQEGEDKKEKSVGEERGNSEGRGKKLTRGSQGKVAPKKRAKEDDEEDKEEEM